MACTVALAIEAAILVTEGNRGSVLTIFKGLGGLSLCLLSKQYLHKSSEGLMYIPLVQRPSCLYGQLIESI